MAFVRPEEAVENFELRPGMTVADFGCGSGHYSIAAAKRVGDFGKVYAIDIQKELLEAIKGTAEVNHLKNIEPVWADLDVPNGSKLQNASVDFVVISNILFQAEKRDEIAKEALRILKNGGKVAVIEWKDKALKEEIMPLFIQTGFRLEKEFQPGDNHYGIIFRKSEIRNSKSETNSNV
jgi:ubiquinone/menaquinone biosynthesis C-methylase UbiE